MDYDTIANNRDFCRYSQLFLYNMNTKVNEYLNKHPMLNVKAPLTFDTESLDIDTLKINAILSRISMKKSFGVNSDDAECKTLNDSLELLRRAKEKNCFTIEPDPVREESKARMKKETGMVDPNIEENFNQYLQDNQADVTSYVDLQMDLAQNFETTVCAAPPIIQFQNAKVRSMKRKKSTIV